MQTLELILVGTDCPVPLVEVLKHLILLRLLSLLALDLFSMSLAALATLDELCHLNPLEFRARVNVKKALELTLVLFVDNELARDPEVGPLAYVLLGLLPGLPAPSHD